MLEQREIIRHILSKHAVIYSYAADKLLSIIKTTLNEMKKLLAILTLASISLFSLNAVAQDSNAPAAKADAPKVATKSLADMWRAGGITMYPLGLFAIFGTTLIIYNFIAIRRKKFLNPKGVVILERMVNQLQIKESIDYCEKNPSPITNIIGAGLARSNDNEVDADAMAQAMEEASVEEFAGPYVLINYLSVIASLAPMMGLYGTVSGMVKAFNTIAAEGAGSASKLADNISEALITTAAGMIIGIPAMFFFFFFKNRYGAIISSSSRIIGDIIFTLKTSLKYGPQDISELEADAEGDNKAVIDAAAEKPADGENK